MLNFVEGVTEEDAIEAMKRNSYDPRISVCIEYGVEVTAQQLVDAGTFEVDAPFTADDLLDASLLNEGLAENPEWIADLPPLPDQCRGLRRVRRLDNDKRRGGGRFTASARLTVDGLSHWFVDPQTGATVHALDDINMAIQPGEFVTVVGPSGCGKTTLLKILAGFIKPGGARRR